MSSRTLNRKQFLVFTASAAAASVLAACGEDDPGSGGGSSGSGGSGTAGSSGSSAGGSTAGSGGSGTAGSASGSGGAGTAGSGGAGTAGSAGAGTAGSGGSTAGSGGASGGSGGGGGSGGSGGGMCNGDIMVTSSGQHTHTLLVTAAQITAGTEVTILSGGMNGDPDGHKHQVKITAADFTALKAGMEVKKKSCAGGDHEYVLKCGAGASQPMAPTCNDECGGEDAASACN